jgi:hypothetical protein
MTRHRSKHLVGQVVHEIAGGLSELYDQCAVVNSVKPGILGRRRSIEGVPRSDHWH